MTSRDKPGSNAPGPIDGAEKKKLLARVGVAGALIVALIGALALFEQQQKPQPSEPESKTVPGPAQSLPAPEAPNQASGSIPPAAVPDSKPEMPAEPERTAAPQIAEPAAAEKTTAEKGAAEKASTQKGTAPARDPHPRLVVGKGSEAPAAPVTPPTATQTAPTKSAMPEPPPVAKQAAGTGYLVQVGVFSNLGNAEELRKKLADAGIPAQIEARVQVGPFATQAEAAAAQKKLKALGMEPGMVLPPRR